MENLKKFSIYLAILVLVFIIGGQYIFSASSLYTDPNLELYLKGDGNVTDSSGNGHTVTFIGDTAYGTGKYGQAFSFNSSEGTEDYLSIQTPHSFPLGSDARTISLWYYPTTTGYDAVLGYGDTTAMDDFYLFRNSAEHIKSNKLSLSLWGGAEPPGDPLTSDTAITANNWYHIVITYDSSNAYMYINGVEEDSNTGLTYNTSDTDLNIGKLYNYDEHFTDGLLDEVMIFSRALSASEVAELYASDPNTGGSSSVGDSAQIRDASCAVSDTEIAVGDQTTFNIETTLRKGKNTDDDEQVIYQWFGIDGDSKSETITFNEEGDYKVSASLKYDGDKYTVFCPSVIVSKQTQQQEEQPEETPSKPTFSRDLELNMEGDDVLLLQKLLNSIGYTIATEGPGSPNNETTFFGPLTQNALIKFQKDYDIYPPLGYFGPITRAVMRDLGRIE